ncbi:MAG: hypothetical protein JST08_04200 [Actinobacteria bacterium]|nr:hypothetical protein [Actinomycetota bacterium]
MGRKLKAALGATTIVAMLAASLGPADAARQPTAPEAKAIKRAALRACHGHGPPGSSCRFHGARVSTRDPHYAWADVTVDGFSAALLKRPTKRSTHFHVVAIQGGGIELCSKWRKKAPERVLADLHVVGLYANGSTGSCG